MFSFNFASKMLNTIMGTEDQPQQQQQQQGGPPQQTMGGPPGQQGMRPMGAGFPPMRPQPIPGGSPRPGFPGPPTFSGPRPSPGARAGPPSFGGPPRPTMGGVGTPHRFNGPQPPQQQHPGQINRGMSPLPGARTISPGPPRQRGPGPMGGPGPMATHGSMGVGPGLGGAPTQSFPQRPVALATGGSSGAAPVPEVDLSHLSAEERAMIENVMAKAQQLEQGPPAPAPALSSISQPTSHNQQQQHQRMLRPEAQHAGVDMMGTSVRMCPVCRQRDVSGKMDGIPGQECADCRLVVCNRCGGMSPHPETKRSEWTCGNCINNRRQRMGQQFPTHGPASGHHQQQQQLQQQQQFQQQQQQPPGQRMHGQQPGLGMDVDSRSGGGMMQHQNEREFDKIESKEKVGSWSTETRHRRRPSFEDIFSPEKSDHSEEPLPDSPVDVDFSFSSDPSFPDHSQCMSTPHTASASQAKPSFVISNNKLHSRSVSIDIAGKQDSSVLSPPQNGFDYYAVEQYEDIPAEQPSCSYNQPINQPPQPPPVDEKTSALMEELSKLQSAVDSTLKRRQRQKQETDEDVQMFKPIRSRSPSPSPSPRGSPLADSPTQYKSPLQFRTFSPEMQSPESPDAPGPRKAIVAKEQDLDDYKSSSEEESVASDDSDDGRKGMGEGMPSAADVYYDHSPGEVYTIPEEEDEGGSPTGGDLVTSLKRQGIGLQPTVAGDMGAPRRRVGGQNALHIGGGVDPRQPMRPQLRPQRSLDNRLPSTQPQMDPSTHQSMDQLGNIYATNNNVNTQSVAHPGLGPMDNQSGNQMLASSMGLPTSSQPSAMVTTATSSAIQYHPQQPQHQQQMNQQQQQQQQEALNHQQAMEQQQSQMGQNQLTQQQLQSRHGQQPSNQQLQGMFSATGLAGDFQHDPSQRSIQQSQQLGQIAHDNLGLGMGGTEWNSSSQSSVMGPAASVSVSSTEQSSINQPYQQQQQQQPSSTYSTIPTSSVPPQTVQQQQFQQQSQNFPQQSPASHPQMQAPQPDYQQTSPLAPLQPPTMQSQQHFPSQNLENQHLQSQQQSQVQQLKPLQDPMGLQNMPNQQQMTGVGALQGSQLQQLQAQQAQAQQLAQQQSWLQQADQQAQQQQNVYDQSGRLASGQFSQSPSPLTQQSGLTQSQDQYQQSLQLLQQQNAQGMQHLGAAGSVPGHGTATSQAGPGAKSISGLLADFSRALGLGSTSPRPSPPDDKSLAFPMSSSLGSMPNQGQPLSPYDPYHSQPLSTSLPQSHQQSAFASIHDSYRRQNQQLSYLSQSPQQQPGQMMTSGQLQQQYGAPTLVSPQPYPVVPQGALSPAQAHMYQQQMAMQHQQQHMKKRSRGGHMTTSGDVRRDGQQQSTVLIGGQSLAVTPGGMTAIGPAVVTSLGTFIGGGSTMLGTQLLQSQPSQGFGAWTLLGTPIGTPVGTPRSGREPPGGGDSSDTMSETDSQKSLRMRRKLPCLPPDQEAAPLPSTKKRDRHRSQEHFRSVSPLRMQSTDGMSPGRQYPFSSLGLSRPSASESNLRKISLNASDPVPRPGSALGLLQASSVVSSVGGKPDMAYPQLSSSLFSTSTTFPGMRTSVGYPTEMTTTTSVLAGLYPSHKASVDSWNANLAELAACLPPDLRHLLNKGTGSIEYDLSGIAGISGLGDSSSAVGSQLPSYIRSLREQLQEERRQLLSEERRRLDQLRERDRELGARLDAVTNRSGSEGMRSRTDLGISRSAGASPQLSRKLKSHRRQLSDPKLSLPFSPIQEDGDSELQDFDRISASLLRPPYKSYEYESLEDGALLHQRSSSSSVAAKPHFDWDHSQSYLASSWAAAGGVLRETAINSMDRGPSSRYLSRRNSEGEQTSMSTSRLSSSSGSRERRHQVRKHRKSRSWNPSPYVSEEDEEEEEDMLSREEKKSRIKAEIARRRQQMQERGGINQSASYQRMRDPTDPERHSVLKSVDQLIRDQYGRYDSSSPSSSSYGRFLMYAGGGVPSASGAMMGRYHHHGQHGVGGDGTVVSPCASEEDRSIERIASTFRSDELYYERLGEMSPFATDSESMCSELGPPAAMPILPDMPTRSRRLLEDLGSAPIGLNEGSRGGSSSGQNMKERRQSSVAATPFHKFASKSMVDVSSQSRGHESPNRKLHHPYEHDKDRRGSGDARGKKDTEERLRMRRPPGDEPPTREIRRHPDQPVIPRRHPDASARVRHHYPEEMVREQVRPADVKLPTRDRGRRFSDPSDKDGGGRSDESANKEPRQNNPEKWRHRPHEPEYSRSYPEPHDSSHSPIGESGPWTGKVDTTRIPSAGNITPQPEEQAKKSQESSAKDYAKKYWFPVKRYLLTRDLKDQSIESNGIGMKIIGGKEIPDANGHLGAYVSKIFPEKLGNNKMFDIQEGDVVLEWNGFSLGNKTFEEVAAIVQDNVTDEVELIVRSNYSILTGNARPAVEKLPAKIHQSTQDGPNQKLDETVHEEQRRSSEFLLQSPPCYARELESGQDLPEDETYEILESTGHEINARNLVSGSQRFSNLSPTSSTSQSGTMWDDQTKFSHHLAIPTETDLRKSSTSSLPPSLTDMSEHTLKERCGRKGSENISVKSMGLGCLEEERKLHVPTRGKKGSYGQIQLQICHDPRANVLYLTVIKAKLPKPKNEDGTDHVVIDPYVTVYLLPDRIVENQRRTRHLKMTSNPQWNQTMVYPNVTVADLKEKCLEVSVKNAVHPTGDDPLFGKIILYLSDEGILDEQPHTYSLRLEEKPYRRKNSHLKSLQDSKTSSTYSSRCSFAERRKSTDDKGDPGDEMES